MYNIKNKNIRRYNVNIILGINLGNYIVYDPP